MTQAMRGYVSQEWDITLFDKFDEAGGATQSGALGLGAQWGILGNIAGANGAVNGVMISLAPSTGGASSSVMAATNGQMLMNTDYSQYWWLLGAGVEIAPDSASPVTLTMAAPIGTQDMNSVTSSVSIGAGFFGGDPTASGNWSSSYTTSYSDFQVADLSQLQGSALRTLYYMSAYSDGEFYPDGKSFLTWQQNQQSGAPDFVEDLREQCGGPRLHQPCVNAWQSSLPLISQGIWAVDQTFMGVTTFNINLYLTFVAWHINFAKSYAATTPYQPVASFQIDWSQVPGQGSNPPQTLAAARPR